MVYIKKINNQEDLEQNTTNVLAQLHNTIISLDYKKALILLFWLDNWGGKLLKEEATFDYNKVLRFKRGNVVQADFGFKIGSEQGGLHYALVIENDNGKSNQTVMVIPLSSLDESEKPENINNKHEVFLGYSLFTEYIRKLETKIERTEKQIVTDKENKKNLERLEKDLHKNKETLIKLNRGSVALINQMCALSKIRIIKPKYVGDDLQGYELPNDKMHDIDAKIMSLFLSKSD